MGTIQKQGTKILGVVHPKDAKRFLVDFANVRALTDVAYLLKRYTYIFRVPAEEWNPDEVLRLRDYLRKAWDAPDQRSREWHIFQLRAHYASLEKSLSEKGLSLLHQRTGVLSEGVIIPMTAQHVTPRQWFEDVPAITPLEATMFYFQARIADRAKHCGHTICSWPYFIAEKRWQKFCSEECAGPANRESKRKWWHEKGRFL